MHSDVPFCSLLWRLILQQSCKVIMNVSLCCVTLEDSYQKKSHNNILEYPSKF